MTLPSLAPGVAKFFSGFSSAKQIAIALFAVCVTTQAAQAQSATWTATGSGTWITTGNWSTASNPSYPGSTSGTTDTDIATFASNGNGTVTLPAYLNVGGINFTGSSAYTINSGTLSLSNGGAISLTSAATASDTINSAVLLEPGSATTSGTATFTNNSSANTLTIGGAVSGDTTTGAITLNLAGSNTGSNTVSGIIGNGGAAGGLNLTKSGLGTWDLSGTNTYTGATTVEGGTLALTGANGQLADTSSVTVEGGASLVLGSSTGVTNRISTGANLTLGGSYIDSTTPSLDGTLIVTKASSGNNNQTLNSLTIASGSNDLITGSAASAGTLTFSGSNPYVHQAGGFVIVNTSTVTVDFTNAPTGATNISNGVLVGAYEGYNLSNSLGVELVQDVSGALTPATLGTINDTTASYYTSGTINAYFNTNSALTMSGAITVNSISLIGTDAQDSLILTGTNTIGAPGILYGDFGANAGVISGGTIKTAAVGGELIIYTAGSGTLNLSSAIADNSGSSLNVGGTGTLNYSGAASYTGATLVSSGATFKLSGSGSLNSTGTITVFNGASFNDASSSSLGNAIINQNTVIFSGTTTQTYSGSITDAALGTSTLNHTGTGTLILV